MRKNDTVEKFYIALSKGDWKLMHNLYSKDVIYNDEIFRNLNFQQVTCMWESLIKRCPDMSITYRINFENDKNSEVRWALVYSYGPKNKKVVISCLSSINLLNGKIVRHTEVFDFKKWAQQAFGFMGRIKAKSPKFREWVVAEAAAELQNFINKKEAENKTIETKEKPVKKPKKPKS